MYYTTRIYFYSLHSREFPSLVYTREKELCVYENSFRDIKLAFHPNFLYLLRCVYRDEECNKNLKSDRTDMGKIRKEKKIK